MKEFLEKLSEFWAKLRRSKVFWIALIIVVQSVVYAAYGAGKNYIHMDEAYSYGSANYNKLEILDEENFNNRWHPAEYYRAYLVTDWYERWDFEPVYANQRDDVHPPLYHLLLRLVMELTPGEFTVWPGIILNMVIFAVEAAFLYLVVWKLFGGGAKDGEKNVEMKAGILTLAASLTIAAVNTVIYVRMYALLTMWVTISAYLHLRLLDTKKASPKLLVAIGATTLFGFLTQYYFLFFVIPMFVVVAVRYLRTKRWKEFWAYFAAQAGAGVVSLIIWPWSIKHLFFGYRGQGAMENLLNFGQLGEQLGAFFGVVTLNVFYYTLPLILIAMFALAVYGLRKGKRLPAGRKEDGYFYALLWPVLAYFVIVAIASPYREIRYMDAVCGLMFVLVMLGLYKLLGVACREKVRNIVMAGVLAVTVILPLPLGIKPETQYGNWATATNFVEEHKEAPLLYIYDMGNNRFLDDITLFTIADWSYIMSEQKYTVEDFERVLETKDLGDGVVVIANYGWDNQEYLDKLKEATGLTEQEYIFRLNAADLYYIH